MTNRRHRQATALLKLGHAILRCDLALTPDEQRIGLTRHASLADGDAMLFPFDPPRRAMFHMSTVSFPIDIVFVDKAHRVARVVHNVQPGTQARWEHAPTSAVIEVPGGFCERYTIRVGNTVEFDADARHFVAALEGYNAPVSKTEPGSHGKMTDSRFVDRDLPDESSPEAMDGAAPHWDQEIGYDPTTEEHRTENAPALYRMSGEKRIDVGKLSYRRHLAQGLEGAELPNGEIVDPVAFALGAVKALGEAARSGDSLTWRPDVLTGGAEEYAYVTAQTIKIWLDHIGVGDVPSVVSAATSASGMDVIANTMVIAEVATRTRLSPDGKTLILYRNSDQVE